MNLEQLDRRVGNDGQAAGGAPVGWRIRSRGERAFTLLELLIVIAIIGIVASMALPSITGMKGSNSVAVGTRQLLDDLAYARLRAIGDRTTVYVVFVPPWITNYSSGSSTEQERLRLLKEGQYRSYALLAKGTVGDHPGRPTPRYLTDWKTLPDGVFIAASEYNPIPASWWATSNELVRPFQTNAFYFPFPGMGVSRLQMPYIAFNSEGQLAFEDPYDAYRQRDELLVLASGSVAAEPADYQADPRETPAGNSTDPLAYNRIRINWLTGRAEHERKLLQ